MYDMYAWNQPASPADEHAEPGARPGEAGRAANGTQVAYAGRPGRADHAGRPGHPDHAGQAGRADHADHADRPDHAGGNGHVNGAARASTGASRAVQAVQVALDRRDNGGDAGSGLRG